MKPTEPTARSSWRARPTLAVVVALVLSACAGAADEAGDQQSVASTSDETQRTAPGSTTEQTSVTTFAGTVVPSVPGCREEVVEDEYGFPVTAVFCADAGPDDGSDLDELLDSVPSEPARAALAAGFRSADAVNAVCDDLPEWARQGNLVADGVYRIAELIEGDEALADWVGGDEARSIGALLRNRLVVQSGCEAPADLNVSDEGLAGALRAAGRLTGANDDVRFALVPAERPEVASEFWFHADQLTHVLEARRLLAAGGIDVVMVGPSSARRGFDPLTLSQASGEVYFNASVAALIPGAVPGWLDALFGIGVSPSTVIISIDAWIDYLPCSSGALQRALDTPQFAARAFATVPGLRDVPAVMRLVGGDDGSNDGYFAEFGRTAWQPDAHGVTAGGTERRQEQVDFQVDAYSQRLEGRTRCPDVIASVESTVASLGESGVSVVLVVLPMSDLMSELVPGGRPAVDAVIDDYQALSVELGARLIDLSRLVPDDDFVDITHVRTSGRELITAALIDELIVTP